MTPKGAKKTTDAATKPKAKPKAAAATPDIPKSVSKVVKKTATPKPKPSAPVFKALAQELSQVIPVNVTFEGENTHAKLGPKGGYSHLIKVDAPSAFNLTQTVMLVGGDYDGQQAILIQPAKPFPFMSLPQDTRMEIYDYYSASKEAVNAPIVVDGKRATNKDLFAKTYADNSKDRVGFLAVSKEINGEATSVLYNQPLVFDNTTSLLDFISIIPIGFRHQIKHVTIKTWVKSTAKNAIHFLGEAHNLQTLRIEAGIFPDADPVKAARYFHSETYRFLEAMAAAKGSKDAAIDVLEFGRNAFTSKNDQKQVKPWAEDLVDDFLDELKTKMN